MFEVSYHHKIPADLAKISSPKQKLIRKAIEDKLVIDPIFFGKPLQFSLKGYRSMRAGDYRVVFEIKNKSVFIILIEHRSTVYQSFDKRL